MNSKQWDGVDVVIAQKNDYKILLGARLRNCPRVSYDGYDDWKKGPRLAHDLREWAESMSPFAGALVVGRARAVPPRLRRAIACAATLLWGSELPAVCRVSLDGRDF